MAHKQMTSARRMEPPPGYVSLPPPVPAQDEEPVISGSFCAPEDLPLSMEELRAAFAPRGARIAALVRETFAKRRYGPARYRLRLGEPKGANPESAHPARQTLTLVSRKDSAPAIACGWVDLSKRDAQVRSYPVVVQRHRTLYGHAPDLSEAEYKRFLGALIETLFDGGVRLVLLAPEPRTFRLVKVLTWLRQGSVFSPLGTTLLVVLAFALGLNAEHLGPWLEQVPSWLEQVSDWGQQALSWIRQVSSWLLTASGLAL